MWREGHPVLASALRGVAAAALLLHTPIEAGGLPAATAADVKRALAPAGRPRLIHAWATWCAPCVAEWPELAEAMRSWGRRIDLVTLAVDDRSRAGKAAHVIAGAGGAPGRHLLAPPADAVPALQAFDPEWDGAVPATWLLAPDGTLLLAQRGGTRLKTLDDAIAKLESQRAEGANDAKERRRR